MRNLTRQTPGHAFLNQRRGPRGPLFAVAFALLFVPSGTAKSRPKTAPTLGSPIEVAATLADALKAVEEVASDPVVYGTYVYERDQTLMGARQVDASSAFGKDVPEGKIFYKVLDNVLAPRHFKDAEDSGTITVRYVVGEVNPTTVNIRVDSVFVESGRRVVHPSEGAVESAEFGQVQQHLNRIQARAREALEEAAEETKEEAKEPARQEAAPASTESVQTPVPSARPAAVAAPEPLTASAADASSEPAGSVGDLEQRVNRLRHQAEVRVKPPGAPLKSAPFHTATTIQTVTGNAEVAVVVITPYWYGVQTTDGHTGWIQRSQLEPLP